MMGLLCVLLYAFKTILGEDIHRSHQMAKGSHSPKKAALKAQFTQIHLSAAGTGWGSTK